ncbi:nuclear transport factor 2 family protein [Naasia sp. SYSU D00057]|uniref:nuclear transport factor 2 family protein n=1 Tax=Naasia sp. SYSU D00057 TaxID=2817380 RepID=UPI001B30E21C|nr:nuclear transport factor 2 family protein [Naasia sp. SYSU D00057]
MSEQSPLPAPSEPEVLAAAAAIVDAFAATDGERYFATFAADATFVFHTEPQRLPDRGAYERIWAGWLESGWRVVSCASTDQLVQPFPGGAVFTHTVDTTVDTGAGTESYRERETIVFRVADPAHPASGLVAVHEHLSPQPSADDDAA